MMRQLDEEFNRYSGAATGFEANIAAEPYRLDALELQGCRQRYAVIKRFQEIVIEVFRRSLSGDLDPCIARGILGDVPTSFAASYHQELPDEAWKTPMFFRTDEAALGQLTEIQCCGSGWDLAEVIFDCYSKAPERYGEPLVFKESLAASYANALRHELGSTPIVHHLVDSASRPHGARYFIQKSRANGIRYFSYDADVNSRDCNLIRSHDFFSLLHHNFFNERLERCAKNEVLFDLPPLALFDTKYILAWPFWSKTREFFSDEIRAIFPFTAVIEEDAIEWEDGRTLTFREFSDIPNKQRNYFVKYAGTDVAINWGSKAVFSTKSLSRVKCVARMEEIAKDVANGRPWILQKAVFTKQRLDYLCPTTGDVVEFEGNGKWSNFYGPTGLLSQLVMSRNAHKVHGSGETSMSLTY